MAHFAQVEDSVVTQVIAVNDSDAPSESAGKAFIAALGLDGEWVQTSYTGSPIDGVDRGPYAGIGYFWDGQRFIAPYDEVSA